MFEKCMIRYGFDMKVIDYTWKQNKLNKDKEALKNMVMGIIKKKDKNEIQDEQKNQG